MLIGQPVWDVRDNRRYEYLGGGQTRARVRGHGRSLILRKYLSTLPPSFRSSYEPMNATLLELARRIRCTKS